MPIAVSHMKVVSTEKILLTNWLRDIISHKRIMIVTDKRIPLNRKIFMRDIPSKGPSAVWSSVLQGMRRLNQHFTIYTRTNKVGVWINKKSTRWIILNWTGNSETLISFLSKINSPKVILGPNINLDDKLIAYLKNKKQVYSNFLTPSDFVSKNLIRSTHGQIKITTWAAGVEYRLFTPGDTEKKFQIGVYVKGSLSNQDITHIKQLKEHFRQDLVVIEYGKYTPPEYISILKKLKVVFWFGGTESQGLALLEAWSAGVPTIVRYRKSSFDINHPSEIAFAPYNDEKTGGFFEENDSVEEIVDKFYSRPDVDPREKILSEFTNELTTRNLLELF
jgi:hypothetical protein